MQKRSGLPPQLRNKGFQIADIFTALAVMTLIFYLAWQLFFNFKYDWQWAEIPRFLITKDNSGAVSLGPLGQGLALSIKLSIWASVLALFSGFVLALGRLSSILYFNLLSRTVVEISRNIPPLVLIFIGFYFLSSQLLPWDSLSSAIEQSAYPLKYLAEAVAAPLNDLNIFFPVVITLALYEAAYFSEIFRGAILSMQQGQWEASWCLGLSRYQRYRYVIMPQVLKKTAPQMAGQFISTVKDSSIVSVVSLAELSYSAMKLSATYHRLFEIWLSAAVLYFLLNFSLSCFFKHFE